METYQENLNSLMRIRKQVYMSHGPAWPCTTTTDCVRGTFGVGNLIAEAIEMSNRLGTPREYHVAGFFMDEATSLARMTQPSKIRTALKKFAKIYDLNQESLNLIVMQLAAYGYLYRYSYDIHHTCGIDSMGRKVAQSCH